MAELTVDSATVGLTITGNITLKTRTSWVFQHLRSAAFFAGESARLDVGGSFPPHVDIDTRYVAAATAAIIQSACVIEATVNELRSDLDDPSDQHLGRAAAAAGTLVRFWDTVERRPALEKLQWILHLSGCEEFDSGSDPFQSAADLMHLRNALVHFRVEWTGEASASTRLEARFGGRFPPSSWAAPSQVFFPYRCIGAGAARWAYTSARDLLPAFFERLGTKWRLRGLATQLDDAFTLGRGDPHSAGSDAPSA